MSDNIYGGIMYPNTSFQFDKVYPNLKTAQEEASTDGVALGRYILVAYCDTALSQDHRNVIETQANSNRPSDFYQDEDYKNYMSNFKTDGKKSYDRHVFRKVYGKKEENETELKFYYEDIASLNSTLSDDSITVRGVADGDKILSLSNLNDGGILSTTLTIDYFTENGIHKIGLKGKNGHLISAFDASNFVKDSFLSNVEYNGNNELIFTFITKDLTTNTNIEQKVPVTLDIMDPGNGINISENDISIKLDTTSENYLTVGPNGLKLFGVNNAIETLRNEVNEKNEEQDIEITSINTALGILEDKELIASNPSAKITWTNTGSFEVGTKITPNYSISFTDGKYKYPLPNGTAIGSSIGGYSINLNNETRTTASAEFGEITITENTNLTGTATVSFNAGANNIIPVSNLGRPKPNSKYNGQDVNLKPVTITGYREGCFYGAKSNKIETWDSNKIRAFGKMGSGYIANKKLTLNIPEGTQTILIACPASCNGPSNVLNTTVNAPMTELFGSNKIKDIVSVNGVNGYNAIDYNIWVYQPAEPYSSSATLEITLG